MRLRTALLSCFWAIFLSGCTSYEVRTTDFQSAEQLEVETPDDYLLDVGIEVLEPDIEGTPDDGVMFSRVREAESVWVAQKLKETLEHANAWGAVRITPDEEIIMDLQVHGKITQSDGETLSLDIHIKDQTGRTWLEKNYSQAISRYAYDPSLSENEPFQGLYNEIANDMLDILRQTTLDERQAIRSVSAMRFAQSFSPAAFDQYLVKDGNGYYQLDRLPADNDPMLDRVQSIQARDHMFVDVLQDYYFGFASNMQAPYREWRAQSYQETQLIRDLQTSARNRRLAGWLAIVSGAAASMEGNQYVATAGVVGIMAGLTELQQSYSERDEASLHIQTLSEIGQSLEEELEPNVIELQDRTITLTGTVRDQYEEWRKILANMYY
ncbi:MAG: hypothetical protein RLN96_13655, partial [Pseudomonadales bacterium]